MIKSRDQIQFAFIIYVFLASEVRWAPDMYLLENSGWISLDHSCSIQWLDSEFGGNPLESWPDPLQWNYLRVKNMAHKFFTQPTQIFNRCCKINTNSPHSFSSNHLFWKEESFSFLSTIHLKFISHGDIGCLKVLPKSHTQRFNIPLRKSPSSYFSEWLPWSHKTPRASTQITEVWAWSHLCQSHDWKEPRCLLQASLPARTHRQRLQHLLPLNTWGLESTVRAGKRSHFNLRIGISLSPELAVLPATPHPPTKNNPTSFCAILYQAGRIILQYNGTLWTLKRIFFDPEIIPPVSKGLSFTSFTLSPVHLQSGKASILPVCALDHFVPITE